MRLSKINNNNNNDSERDLAKAISATNLETVKEESLFTDSALLEKTNIVIVRNESKDNKWGLCQSETYML